jgi:hypothetical protein
MTKPNASYTDLAHQVVRDSREPLPFEEIMERVNEIHRITTRNPKATNRGAIGQSRLIVNSGDGRYGWKYRVINGSVWRIPLSQHDLEQRQITFPEVMRDRATRSCCASRMGRRDNMQSNSSLMRHVTKSRLQKGIRGSSKQPGHSIAARPVVLPCGIPVRICSQRGVTSIQSRPIRLKKSGLRRYGGPNLRANPRALNG